jgi:uncharacterized membrane protein YqjE
MGSNIMPRLALLLVLLGVGAIFATVILVLGDASVPGRVPALMVAGLAGFGGLSLVVGLWRLEAPARRQTFSG